MWMTVAAEQGHERARTLRDIFAKKMSAEQIAESDELAQQWRRR